MLGLLLAMTTLAAAPTRIAVLPLQARGPAPEAMQQLDAAVRIELSRVQGLEVVTLGPRAAPPDCAGSEACVAQFGRRLGASEVLHGEARTLDDSFAVTLRLLDVATGRQRASTASSVNRDVEEMVWATRAQVVRLKAPERWAGLLAVEAPSAARVTVDGSAAQSRELTLAPGTYALKVEAGGRTVQAWVEVRYEQRAVVRASARNPELEVSYSAWKPPQHAAPQDSLPEEPARAFAQRSKWPGVALLALGGGLLAGGILEQVHASRLRAEIDGMRRSGGTFAIEDASRVRELQGRHGSARALGWTLLGAGAAVALGGTTWLWIGTRPGAGGTGVEAGGNF